MELSKSKRRLMERLKKPRQRKREGLVLAEGHRVVKELLRSEWTVRGVWIEPTARSSTLGSSVVAAAAGRGVPVVAVDDGELEGVSDTESPQRVVAIGEEPPAGIPARGSEARVLLLDGVQDPGNVGTLIRTAWAMGMTQVWTSEGCADPWGTKAVRASAGAVFHTDLVRLAGLDDWGEHVTVPLWVADAGGRPVTHELTQDRAGWILAVGNEGAGVSEEVRRLGQSVSIPMAGGADSLNVAVAGSILMYVLAHGGRQPSGASQATGP